MSKKIGLLTLFFVLMFGTMSFAHGGGLDSNGGHNCSPKSQAKGLCSGYHYHNGGGSSSESSTSTTSQPAATRNDKDCSDFATYDDVIDYWNSKGYSATNDPEKLDGWGNKVDDGIPCEAPSGYDKTKINNSPEQIQFKQEHADTENGENQGYNQGLKDGYAEADANDSISEGSEAFKTGYATSYSKGYEEGKKKIASEKTKANNDGYTLGKKQDKIAIPEAYSKHHGLKASFEIGFNKAVAERIEAKKKEYQDLGYKDGKEDTHSPPKDTQDVFVKAYQEGFDKAQEELKNEYYDMGYEDAFSMLKFNDPKLPNDKFTQWYKEGFNGNEEILEIKDAGYLSGEAGEEYTFPSKFKKGEEIFKHYYQEGYKKYEEEQKQNQATAAGGVGLAAIIWLGRRFYVANKMIR